MNVNLHSSMDRLETENIFTCFTLENAFTFQYGQIRNGTFGNQVIDVCLIYIPVWIDQKLGTDNTVAGNFSKIYIPVWIDQKQMCFLSSTKSQ